MHHANKKGNLIASEDLARLLERTPRLFRSLRINHAVLVARLEALLPFITPFTSRTTDLLEKGRREEASQETDTHAEKFAQALETSIEDSRWFCMCLIGLTLMMRTMLPFLQSLVEKKQWEEWFQRLWERSDRCQDRQ